MMGLYNEEPTKPEDIANAPSWLLETRAVWLTGEIMRAWETKEYSSTLDSIQERADIRTELQKRIAEGSAD
jgi:hypothetical protein